MPHELTPTPEIPTLGLFQAVGVELEYMIVDAQSLDMRAISDELLTAEAGELTSDVAFDDVTWSNELVMHVIEIKTTRPVAPRDLAAAHRGFRDHVGRINEQLRGFGARLLPAAMHPWMDPFTQSRLWPHDNSAIYAAFNRVFDCRGHGWANLQSMHLNLPFADDEEFGRLHAAIRLLLPILPALAASSPVMDGRATGLLDNRLHVYRSNCARIPSVTGRVVPEPVFTIDAYHRDILGRIYADLAPHDPDAILRDEWANARGAIARFVRNTIEVRVLDVQECPAADCAIAALVVAVLRLLVEETWSDTAAQRAWAVEPLAALLERTTREAEAAVIEDAAYRRMFGDEAPGPRTAGALWRHLLAEVRRRDPEAVAFCGGHLDTLMAQGPLARRLLTALGPAPDRAALERTYRRLAECVQGDVMFTA